MKRFTIDDIRSWQPCYDPSRHLPENWSGTALDILDNESIPHDDRLWVVLRTDLVSEKLMRLFAVWCARQVITKDTDPRSISAVEIAERYANGQATAAWSAARYAAWYAAWSAARYAAESAARYAAWSAAESAARYAQREHLRKMILAGVETGDTKAGVA